MTKKRRDYDTSFKLEVVRMIKDQGQTVPEVCRDLGVGETAVRRWVHSTKLKCLGNPV